MPELPEVETIRSIIEPQISGQKITSVKINNPQVVAYPDAESFVSLLSGQCVTDMSRRGKFLTINFKSGDHLVLHLRMTGQLLVTPPTYPLEKHTHLIVELSGGNQIRYIDVRRFGRFWLLRKGEADTVSGQSKLGIEPLGDELTGAYLKSHAGKSRKAIKEALLDQIIVAGIGNIYSDEILYAAKINPAQTGESLSAREWNCIAQKIKAVIAWGIETDRMTPEEYLAGAGKEYRNSPDLKVYDREGQPCRRCKTPLEKIIIGGRSSCYCPVCQKKHR